MDEQMIADIAKAICCASPCEGCKGHGEGGCFELDLWSREARAAHSVMAGKVAELTEALKHARDAIASLDDDDLGWSQPPNEDIEPWPLKDELLATIDAALAPHPKGME